MDLFKRRRLDTTVPLPDPKKPFFEDFKEEHPTMEMPARDHQSRRRLVLRVVAGRDLLSFISIAPQRDHLIGRDETAHLRLDDASVSRRHVTVRLEENGEIIIQDLSSRNGTFINGARITRGILHIGDELEIGNISLKAEYLREEEVFHLTRLHRRLREAHNIDPLTGLRTRAALETEVPVLLADTQMRTVPSSCVFFDLDNFKRINDRNGHAVGDDVLRTVGHLVLLSTRETDLAIRYGGDEFVLFLPGSNVYGAADLANRVADRIRDHAWGRISSSLRVFASFGVAAHEAGESLADWLDRADKAMYRAKRLGRNRVEMA